MKILRCPLFFPGGLCNGFLFRAATKVSPLLRPTGARGSELGVVSISKRRGPRRDARKLQSVPSGGKRRSLYNRCASAAKKKCIPFRRTPAGRSQRPRRRRRERVSEGTALKKRRNRNRARQNRRGRAVVTAAAATAPTPRLSRRGREMERRTGPGDSRALSVARIHVEAARRCSRNNKTAKLSACLAPPKLPETATARFRGLRGTASSVFVGIWAKLMYLKDSTW